MEFWNLLLLNELAPVLGEWMIFQADIEEYWHGSHYLTVDLSSGTILSTICTVQLLEMYDIS